MFLGESLPFAVLIYITALIFFSLHLFLILECTFYFLQEIMKHF